jgi:CheY-like chemotaxis protein
MKKLTSILLVDDDQDDCKLFIDSIHKFNKEIRCLVARDGQLALDMLNGMAQCLPSLIFLDLRMPRLDGKKCLMELKKNQLTREIPVIIYTTSRSLLESSELKQLGALHFITKPTNTEEIYYLLSIVLEENLKSISHSRRLFTL